LDSLVHEDQIGLNTLGDRAFQILKERIIRHEISGGTRLSDQEIAQHLDISRTPVREAITRLAAEGLVEVVPRRGAFVVQLSVRDIEETSDVREALERLAIELAVPCLSDEHLRRLQSIIDRTTEAVGRGDDAAYFDLDRQFHEAIVEISGNRKLIETYSTLGATMQAIRWLRCRSREHQEQTIEWHRRILAALVQGDAEGAMGVAADHLREAEIDLIEMERQSAGLPEAAQRTEVAARVCLEGRNTPSGDASRRLEARKGRSMLS